MPAVCPQCDNRQSANKKALLQHMKCPGGCHPRCSFCNRMFINETAFNTYMAVNHPPTHDCTVCITTSYTPCALEDHCRGYLARPKCDRCERGFKDAPAREEHHRTSHPKTPCLSCGGMVLYEDALDQHHWVPRNHSWCNPCDIEFKDDTTTYAERTPLMSFPRHVSTAPPKSQCRTRCGHFETENSVQTHFTLLPVHPKCNKCGQKFQYYDTLNAHREDTHNPTISPLSTDLDATKKDYIIMDEQYDDPGSMSAGAANFTSNMFSSDSCFTGGSYYNIRGGFHLLPPPSQFSPGLKILHRNISASAFHNSRERFPPPRCHPSTRKEILDTIVNHITRTPSTFKILHIFGSEGTGKSAVAQTIAESYGILGACFFFSRESQERNTNQKLIATLAYQLCVNIPGLKRFIVEAVEDDVSMFQKDVDTQIERLVIKPMAQANNEGAIHRYLVLIVVDGIDECGGMKEQRAFLSAIRGAMGRHNIPLYFVITSRPEAYIINWLHQDPISSISHCLDLDLNRAHTKRDIEVYSRSEFERIRSVHRIPESFIWPSQASIQTLVSETNMSFRYASEIMAFIDDQKDTPQNRLEDILRTSTQSSSGGHS